MKLIISSNPKELRKVRLEIELYCKANFTNLDSSKAIIAVDEALQNVMRHAYDMKPDQLIDIFFKKTELNDFEVKIRDYGKQSPLENIKSRDLKDIRPGGLGVYFIKQCSKSSEYKHLPNGIGTELTLVF
jgi:serine/threonine-protein kinase RsbW|tara:strand:- start:140 stop:529 length:390 start_codon:yes stop_codon:yes gene_type:complete